MKREYQPSTTLAVGAILLLLSEAALTYLLAVVYRWVELSLCPAALVASGHCYADWFSVFETVFYGLALSLLAVLPLCFGAFAGSDFRSPILHGLFYISGLLLVLLAFVSEGRLWWQVLLAIAVSQWVLSALLKMGEPKPIKY